MMVADVRRIADDKIETRRRFLLREIGLFQGKIGALPDEGSGQAVVWVYLESDRFGEPLLWERVEKRRIEGAGAYGLVEKMHLFLRGQESCGIAQNVACKGCWRCELSKAVPLGLRSATVEFGLDVEPLFFYYVQCME